MEKYISYRFGAGRYIQEPEVLENSGTEIARFGKRAYIIGGPNLAISVPLFSKTSGDRKSTRLNSSHGDHRDLHSFPTRRSSDLDRI